jgi:hypothetical protein
MDGMFSETTTFLSSKWDVSSVVSMVICSSEQQRFNGDISEWMSLPLSTWKVCFAKRQRSIESDWNISSAVVMKVAMFFGATDFEQTNVVLGLDE